MVRHWNIMIRLVYQWCFDQMFNPRICSLVALKFINDSLDVLQNYHWKYSVTYAKIFWGYRFQQEVWEQKPPETQKDIIMIFEESLQTSTETYSEHNKTSKTELFAKIANGLMPFFNYVLRKLCHRCLNGLWNAFYDRLIRSPVAFY